MRPLYWAPKGIIVVLYFVALIGSPQEAIGNRSFRCDLVQFLPPSPSHEPRRTDPATTLAAHWLGATESAAGFRVHGRTGMSGLLNRAPSESRRWRSSRVEPKGDYAASRPSRVDTRRDAGRRVE